MTDVTRILNAVAEGDAQAADRLLPLVYEELRRLAAQRLSQEKPGQTLDATALVHEAYLRLVGRNPEKPWQGRGHFFAAAAEAMRRILVESARRKRRLRHGGGRKRVDLDHELLADVSKGRIGNPCYEDDRLLAVDGVLDKLAEEDAVVAEVVKLRFFAGLTMEQTAAALGISVRTANRHWAYARAWLYQQLTG
jgi:RNA polymerase sigma factor (TIGR02999 family)